MKTYYGFMNDNSFGELYDGLLSHGLFTEKLPLVFTSEAFLTYCNTEILKFTFN